MAEDFVELGFEAFDFITDKYHDPLHDRVIKVGPWIKERGSVRSGRSKSKSNSKTDKKRRSSLPDASADPKDDDRKMDRYSERPGRSQRGSGDWDDRSRRSGGTARSRPSSRPRGGQNFNPPSIRVDSAPSNRYNPPGSHIYPPPPQPMYPPYPTTAGALIPMPPDGHYPQHSLSRSHSESGRRYRSGGPVDDRSLSRPRSTGRGYSERDRDSRGRIRSRSRSRDRHRGRRHSSGDRKGSRRDRDKTMPIGAALAGAAAGGYLGNAAGTGDWKAGKVDWKAAVAGALVGAFGAGAAEKEWEKQRRRKDEESESWGRRH